MGFIPPSTEQKASKVVSYDFSKIKNLGIWPFPPATEKDELIKLINKTYSNDPHSQQRRADIINYMCKFEPDKRRDIISQIPTGDATKLWTYYFNSTFKILGVPETIDNFLLNAPKTSRAWTTNENTKLYGWKPTSAQPVPPPSVPEVTEPLPEEKINIFKYAAYGLLAVAGLFMAKGFITKKKRR